MKNYFFYDEKECEFVPVTYRPSERIIYTLSLWILCGTVVSAVSLSMLTYVVGSPAEIALKAENKALYSQLHDTKRVIEQLDHQMQQIAQTDNELYRTVLGIDPISEDERRAGIGGADRYSNFDVYSADAADLLRWTVSNLESIERRINIQKVSFEDIKRHYNENQDLMRNIPAIRPINGMILSGYGMRRHPVLGYNRMHEGVDFRARVGTPIYATGDGVVRSASRRGTYGLMLVIDHGHGYETRYAHLSSIADGLRPGTKVERGQVVAKSGNSGVTSGPHLHYEVRQNGRPVDPLNYMFADLTPEEYIEYQRIAQTNPYSMD
ncbi:M23 family metallopeptidase [Balneolaceae bacterium ANBcel3]|nr:M23 family metallopeptidase [Balneolaceae bacterium ANBcel3]